MYVKFQERLVREVPDGFFQCRYCYETAPCHEHLVHSLKCSGAQRSEAVVYRDHEVGTVQEFFRCKQVVIQ